MVHKNCYRIGFDVPRPTADVLDFSGNAAANVAIAAGRQDGDAIIATRSDSLQCYSDSGLAVCGEDPSVATKMLVQFVKHRVIICKR